VIERQLSGDSNAITYALTEWGAQLREPIRALVRWSTPLMIRGPESDEFRPEWLLVALPALFEGRVPIKQSATVGIVVDGGMVQLRATESGIDVGKPDGCELDAVLSANAHLVLGLAAGVLSLADVATLVHIDGDESAVRSFLDAAPRKYETSTLWSSLTATSLSFSGSDLSALPKLGSRAPRCWESLGFVECLIGLQAVVELAEEFVEQMAGGGSMTVPVFAPLPVVLAGGLTVWCAEKAHIQPTLARRLFLMWRWVTEIERPEARVMGADPA